MKEKMLEVMREKARYYGELHGIMIARKDEKQAEYYNTLWCGALYLIIELADNGLISREEYIELDKEYTDASNNAIWG